MRVRRFTLHGVGMSLLALGAALGAGTLAWAAAGGWRHDFAQAETEARAQQRPLLIHFHASWCGPCRQMSKQVLYTPEVMKLLGEKLIGVQVDIDALPDVANRFQINSVPRDLLLSPAGKVLWQGQGFQPAGTYVAQLQQAGDNFARSRSALAKAGSTKPSAQASVPPRERKVAASTLQAPAPKSQAAPRSIDPQPQTRTATSATTKPSATPAAPAAAEVALDGYCPVTLWESRRWQRGTAEFTYVHQDRTFYFTSAAQRDKFKAQPQRYTPQLLGCDPVVLWESERAVPGTARFAAYFDGLLYLFTSADNRARFRANPPQFTQTRHVLNVDALQTRR